MASVPSGQACGFPGEMKDGTAPLWLAPCRFQA